MLSERRKQSKIDQNSQVSVIDEVIEAKQNSPA